MPRPRKQGHTPLSREAVIDAAWAILTEDGLDALSMRALARRLGVEAPSIYHVISSKQALVDALFDGLSAWAPAVPAGLSWDQHLAALGARWRGLLSAWPMFAPMALSRPPRSAPWLAEADAAVGALRGAGFTATEAIYAYKSLIALVAGVVMNEAGPAPSPDLDAPPWSPEQASALPSDQLPALVGTLAEDSGRDFDAWFSLALSLLIDGLRARLARRVR